MRTLHKIETIIERRRNTNEYLKHILTAFGKNGIPKVILKKFNAGIINNELSHLLSDDCTFDLEVKVNEKE